MATVAQISPEKIFPHPANTRVHSDAQINDLIRSIREFGFVKPIIIDEENVILAGHGVHQAALRMELGKVPVIRKRGLSAEQKRAYLIADNRLAELSKWDRDKLLAELADLDTFELNGITPRQWFAPAEKKKPVNVTLGAERFLLQVECGSEVDLEDLYHELTERGLDCKILS